TAGRTRGAGGAASSETIARGSEPRRADWPPRALARTRPTPPASSSWGAGAHTRESLPDRASRARATVGTPGARRPAGSGPRRASGREAPADGTPRAAGPRSRPPKAPRPGAARPRPEARAAGPPPGRGSLRDLRSGPSRRPDGSG